MTFKFRVVSVKIFSVQKNPFKAKRERKSKFNVREVLNLKEASPKVIVVVGDFIEASIIFLKTSSLVGD